MSELNEPICVGCHPGGKWVYVLAKGDNLVYGIIHTFQRNPITGVLTYSGVGAQMLRGTRAVTDPDQLHQSTQTVKQPANDGLAMTSDGAYLYCTGVLSDGLAQYVYSREASREGVYYRGGGGRSCQCRHISSRH